MTQMIDAKDAVVWVNDDTKQVMVRPFKWGVPEQHPEWKERGYWCDPIGAAYAEWKEINDKQRVHLMLETAIDLATAGFDMKAILRVFADVPQFKKLGEESYPMCRALTNALVGKRLNAETMSFNDLLETYKPEELTNDNT